MAMQWRSRPLTGGCHSAIHNDVLAQEGGVQSDMAKHQGYKLHRTTKHGKVDNQNNTMIECLVDNTMI